MTNLTILEKNPQLPIAGSAVIADDPKVLRAASCEAVTDTLDFFGSWLNEPGVGVEVTLH
jgi:hypothetical protein